MGGAGVLAAQAPRDLHAGSGEFWWRSGPARARARYLGAGPVVAGGVLTIPRWVWRVRTQFTACGEPLRRLW